MWARPWVQLDLYIKTLRLKIRGSSFVLLSWALQMLAVGLEDILLLLTNMIIMAILCVRLCSKYLTYINSHNSHNKPTIGMIIVSLDLQMRRLKVSGWESRQFGARVCAVDRNGLWPPLREGSLLTEA